MQTLAIAQGRGNKDLMRTVEGRKEENRPERCFVRSATARLEAGRGKPHALDTGKGGIKDKYF